VDREQAAVAQILTAAGWRAALVTAETPLTAAWQQLHRLSLSGSTQRSAAAAVPETAPPTTLATSASEG
jgi:hypothetical protein